MDDFPKPYSPPCTERENVFEFTEKPAPYTHCAALGDVVEMRDGVGSANRAAIKLAFVQPELADECSLLGAEHLVRAAGRPQMREVIKQVQRIIGSKGSDRRGLTQGIADGRVILLSLAVKQLTETFEPYWV